MLILAIDPGTKILGMALAQTYDGTVQMVDSWAVSAKGSDWLARSRLIVKAVRNLTYPHNIGQAIIEMPKHYNSAKGEAADNSSSIIKLGFVTGMCYEVIRQRNIPTITPWAIQWKGTTPKHITQNRVTRWWGVTPDDHNEADACGIIDWYIRKHLRKQGEKFTIIKGYAKASR